MSERRCYSLTSGAEVGDLFLDYDNSYYYVLDSLTFSPGDAIIEILGYIPVVGDFVSPFITAQGMVTSSAAQDIIDAGGYAYIHTIRDPYSGDEASLVLGWDSYPYAKIYNAESVQSTRFEKHDPFA